MDFQEQDITPKKREVKGLTDKVTANVERDVTFPVINIMLDQATPRYKLQALSKLLKSSVKTDEAGESTEDKSVSVALKTEDTYKVIGRVMPNQIKTLMSILIGLSVELEMEEGRVMDTKYIYALSS